MYKKMIILILLNTLFILFNMFFFIKHMEESQRKLSLINETLSEWQLVD